ncbi:MAG: hypothetical protein ACP5OA_05265 [Candidatus Woesearchaeota archaeon]
MRITLRHAVKEFSNRLLLDEKRYLESILGIGDFWAIYSNSKRKNQRQVIRRDLVYGFWTEEDVRLRLGAELSLGTNCQYHGQTLINRKRNGKKEYQHNYPDMLLIDIKKKNSDSSIKHVDDYQDKNLVFTAIEIKYLQYHGGVDKEDSIITDLDKLVNYINSNNTLNVDMGFFFCLDEVNVAKKYLESVINKPKYSKHPIAYAVVTPKYAIEKRSFPSSYEKYPQSKRPLAYILDKIIALNRQEFKVHKNQILDDDCAEMLIILRKNGLQIGYLEIIDGKYFDVADRTRYYIMLRLTKKYHGYFRGSKKYEWIEDTNKYVRKKSSQDAVFIYKFRKNSLTAIENIDCHTLQIYRRIRKLLRNIWVQK